MATDIGITSHRIVFLGEHNSREWHFKDLLNVTHSPVAPTTTIATSRSGRPATIVYDRDLVAVLRIRLDLGLATAREDLEPLRRALSEQLR